MMASKIDSIRNFMKKSKITMEEVGDEGGYRREQIGRILSSTSPLTKRNLLVIEHAITVILAERRELEEEWKKIKD
jgi:hypothetical protein